MPSPRSPRPDEIDSFVVEFNENSENITPNVSPRAPGGLEALLKKRISPNRTPKRRASIGSPLSLLKNGNSTEKSTISEESTISSASSNGASYLQKVMQMYIYKCIIRE